MTQTSGVALKKSFQVCAAGTLFNPETLECDFPSKVKCGSGPIKSDYVALPSDTHYVRFPVSRPAIGHNLKQGRKFENLEDGPDSVVVRPWTGRPPYFGASHLSRPQKRPTTPSPGRSESKDPVCPRGAFGLLPHPSDCAKFLNCGSGRTFIQSCSAGTYFNPVYSVCDHVYNVPCSHDNGELMHSHN